MKPHFRWLIGLLPATLMSGPSDAGAAPITFYFEGHVTRIHDSVSLDDSVYIGAPFTGGYAFDPVGVYDEFPDNPRVGYYYFGPSAHIWARIGNYDFFTEDLGVFISNDSIAGDLYEPISVTPFVAADYQWSMFSLFLLDRSGSALSSDALPAGVPDLADFPEDHNLEIYLPGDALGIRGTLTSLTPEPSSLVLLAFGAIAMCRRKENR